MGRNYIAERTWADPKERAAQKVLKRERERERRAAEVLGHAQALERMRVCRMKGCGKPTGTGWMNCCSEACYRAMLKELDRRDEVRQARLQGIPVAEYRKRFE